MGTRAKILNRSSAHLIEFVSDQGMGKALEMNLVWEDAIKRGDATVVCDLFQRGVDIDFRDR